MINHVGRLFLAINLSIISLTIVSLYSFNCVHADFGIVGTWFILFDDKSSIILIDKLLINVLVLVIVWYFLCHFYKPNKKTIMALTIISIILCGLFYTQNFLRGQYIISRDLTMYNFIPSSNYQGVSLFFQIPSTDKACQN